MRIFIPTLGRADQVTFRNLPQEIQERVEFVVGDGIPWESYAYRCKCIFIPPVKGIAATRQWIAEESKDTPFVMLDDDLTFCMRREDDPTKFQPADEEDVFNLFMYLERALGHYGHVGVATREGGNRETEPYVYNTRLLRILGYNPVALKDAGARFDRLPVMEDFDVCLQLLRKGYQNIKVNWIAHDQKMSNAAGGCSGYRTMQVQKEAALGLAKLHPGFVTVVQKHTKTAWGGQERTDVRVAWKKAYDSAGVVSLLDQGEGGDTESEG
jgi:hypothetical protein